VEKARHGRLRLLVFGAGASIDGAGPGRPPLTASLPDELVKFAPSSWGNLAPERIGAFRADFEAAMADTLARAAGPGPTFKMSFPLQGDALQWSVLQWDLAAFFFQFELVPDSLYERLVARVRRAQAFDRIAVATLNYDKLLCEATNRNGVRVHLGSEVQSDRLRLCLPHGASYIASTANVANDPRGLLLRPGAPGQALELVGGGPIFQLETRDVVVLATQDKFDAKRSASSAYPPIMSYIEPTKFSATGGSFIWRHRSVFASWAAAADRIVLVGIDVRSDDRHIWEPLAAAPGEILYVAPSASRFTEWSQRLGRRDPDALPARWIDAFDAVCAFLDV
jgi:hypothetical protein